MKKKKKPMILTIKKRNLKIMIWKKTMKKRNLKIVILKKTTEMEDLKMTLKTLVLNRIRKIGLMFLKF